jgi:hypothetical protein
MGLPPGDINSNNSVSNRCINYATLQPTPNWDAVERYLTLHPEQASICDIRANVNTNINANTNANTNTNRNTLAAAAVAAASNSTSRRFTPLYIALRNEVCPVPLSIVNLLLQYSMQHWMQQNNDRHNNNITNIHDLILDDDTIVMACRNPKTTSSIMKKLLSIKPTFTQTKYHWYTTPLHAVAKNGNSLGAIQEFISSHPSSLMKADCIDNGRIPLHIACCDNGLPEVVELFIQQDNNNAAVPCSRDHYSNPNGSSSSSGGGGGGGGDGISTNSCNESDDRVDRVETDNGSSMKGVKIVTCRKSLFERDALGMTPIHCALYRLKYLEECRGGYNQGHTTPTRTGGSSTTTTSSTTYKRRSSTYRHWYLNSVDYDRKCYNAWKVLCICIIHAADALREGRSTSISASSSTSASTSNSNSKRRRTMPAHNDETMNYTGTGTRTATATQKTSTANISLSLHAALDLISMEPNIFTSNDIIHQSRSSSHKEQTHSNSSSSSNSNNTGTGCFGHHYDLDYNDLFRLILHPKYCNPRQLASTIDPYSYTNDLPLHKAITIANQHNSQLNLRNGIRYILEAYPPAVLSLKNLHLGIIPHVMQILANSNNDKKDGDDDCGDFEGEGDGLHMVFDLIKNAPSLLFNMKRGGRVKRTC